VAGEEEDVRRFGKLVIMSVQEHNSLICTCDDAEAHAADFAEELHRMRETRRAERKAAFMAGKFHSAGGYSKALMLARVKIDVLKNLTTFLVDQAAIWSPYVEALETYPGQLTDQCGMPWSDRDAAADFAAVGAQVEQERAS
jgi:hypothetical protein